MSTDRESPIKLVDFGLGKMVDCHGANNKVLANRVCVLARA